MSSNLKKKMPRLGRGLSSLMAHPVRVAVEPENQAESALQSLETDTPASSPSQAAAILDRPANQENAPAQKADSQSSGAVILHITLERITPNPMQPRAHFDENSLRRLADSIRSEGVMQPIIVRPTAPRNGEIQLPVVGGLPSTSYELVAGERRWRAAKLAGLAKVPAIVRELDDRQLAEWALVENLQREDLNPLERASALKNLAERFSLSHEEIAQRVGIERPTISNLLRLLDLHLDVQALIRAGILSAGQGKALAGVESSPVQVLLAQRAVREAWSVRRLEAEVRKVAAGAASPVGDPHSASGSASTLARGSSGGAKRSAYLADVEAQLSQQLQTKVHIKPGRKKGSGALILEFYSLDQFDTLMKRLGVEVG
jgi:ParB family transcriptional regulator, chromosome partitioning protein